MDTLPDGVMVIDIPDVLPPTTKAKRRKRNQELVDNIIDVSEVKTQVVNEEKEQSIDEIAASVKPVVPFIYKSINAVQSALLAKKYPKLSRKQVSDTLDFTDSDIDTLSDPTSRILAKRAKIISKFPDEFALLVVLVSLYQIKLATLNDLNNRVSKQETETVQ